MRLSMASKVMLVILGLLVIFGGWVAWTIEDEYGSGTNFKVQTSQDGAVIVYDVDEQGTDAMVFEGSEQEAQAYMEQRRAEGKSFVVPGVVIAVGALLLVGALVAPRRSRKHVA